MTSRSTTCLVLGLCTMALAACETSGPSRGGIYEGPAGGGALVVERQPPLREPARDYGRPDRGVYDGQDGGRGYDDRRYEGGRADRGRDLYDDRGRGDGRYGDRRDPCLDIPGYDPRYDRCDR